jgi:hypothetical protein
LQRLRLWSCSKTKVKVDFHFILIAKNFFSPEMKWRKSKPNPNESEKVRVEVGKNFTGIVTMTLGQVFAFSFCSRFVQIGKYSVAWVNIPMQQGDAPSRPAS